LSQQPEVTDPTVLVVDDDPALLQLVAEMLSREGFTVLEAFNATRALELCRQYHGPIHLLITDYSMPDMNGRELSSCIRSLRPNIFTIYTSGIGHQFVLQGSPLEHQAGFLQKPFTYEELVDKIEGLLGLSRKAG
jgi:CheY-like chemotaxis protein